jgi:rsbT co-antagonist protein RsbR
VVRQTDLSPEQRLDELLEQGKASNIDLVVALARLKLEMAGRERTTQELREKLELIRRQEETLRTLAVPIVQVWDGVLTVPLMGLLDAERAAGMTERLLSEIVRTRSRFTILDLTAIDYVDSSTANHLVRIVRAIDLLGARAIITGIRPQVAHAIVALGVDLSAMTTLRDLQEGLRACMRWLAEEQASGETRGSKFF